MSPADGGARRRWRRIRALYEGALQRSPGQRAAFLAETCADDQQLRREVQQLLDEDARPDGLLASQDMDRVRESFAEPVPLAAGERLGAYRVQGVLGRGGMGTVYRAEQDNPRRTVALKVMRGSSPAAVQRFQLEAVALARLAHPGIAQIYEAGTVERGGVEQPFFAMEHIEGLPITEWAAERELGTRERLVLFAQVCDAVQHAHQKGVIHRDLKPANILVDGGGQPKLLDLGIARLVDDEPQLTELTQAHQLVGTLPYMSPEQLSGDGADLDTRSDIHALGVLLFELLTGRLPNDVSQLPLPQAVRALSEDEPLRLAAVESRFRGDLDTIVAKALEKDRERRYATASALAADVRRYLAEQPITARPASSLYQMRKFARRHRGLVGGLVATVLAISAGLVVSLWWAFEATAERDHAQRMEIAAEEERVLAEVAQAEAIRARVLADEAREEAVRARVVADGARAEAERSEASTRAVGELLLDILSSPHPLEQGRDARVVDQLDRGVRRLDAGWEGRPEVEAAVRIAISESYHGLGLFERAEQQARLAHTLAAAELGPRHLLSLRALHSLAASQIGLAMPTGLDLLVECDALYRSVLGPHHEDTLRVSLDLAMVLASAGRMDEGRVRLEEIESVLLATQGSQSEALVRVSGHLALIAAQAGEPDVAEERFREALALRRQLSGPAHPQLAELANNLGMFYRDLGRLEEAEIHLREALFAFRKGVGEQHPDVGACLQNLAGVCFMQGKGTDAEQFAREAAALHRRVLPDDHPDLGMTLNTLGVILNGQGLLEEAAGALREAHRIRQRALGPGAGDTLDSAVGLAQTLVAIGGREELEEVVTILEGVLQAAEDAGRDPDDRNASNTRLLIGRCLLALGQHARAEAVLLAAEDGLVQVFGDDSPALRDVRTRLVELYTATGDSEARGRWAAKLQVDS